MTATEQIREALDDIKRYALMGAKSMFTVDEAAEYTGLKRQTLYRLTNAKEIPHYKPNGRIVYFDRKELDNWLRRGKVETREESEANAALRDYRRG